MGIDMSQVLVRFIGRFVYKKFLSMGINDSFANAVRCQNKMSIARGSLHAPRADIYELVWKN